MTPVKALLQEPGDFPVKVSECSQWWYAINQEKAEYSPILFVWFGKASSFACAQVVTCPFVLLDQLLRLEAW
jgi:hypothetical protein